VRRGKQSSVRPGTREEERIVLVSGGEEVLGKEQAAHNPDIAEK